jgi:AcrR family transcriptional regulator
MSPASERSPGSRGESKGEATRARIIQRALELATRVGLEGLSIGDLAQDLGLSKSGLFAHFGSKEQLQLDVLDAAAELFRAVVFDAVMRGAVGQARLVALFENMLKWVQARDLPGGCIFMAGAFEWDDAQGPVRQRMVEWFEKLNASLARVVASAVEQGEFRADLDVELLAYELHSIALKYHLETRLLRSKKALVLARRAFQRLLADARADARS